MKKYSWILCCAIFAISLIFILPTRAQAAEIIDSGTCGPSVTWTLDSDGTLTISGTGAIESYRSNAPDITQDITRNIKDRPWENNLSQITTLVIQEGITEIGVGAFAFCENLTQVTIPKSLAVSDMWAFVDCYSLSEVYISDLVAWVSLDAFAWDGNPLSAGSLEKKLYLNGQLVTDPVIPSGATKIATNSFADCSSIKSVTILEGVTQIDDYAFNNCKNLVRVTIPKSLANIGSGAFSGCVSLTEVDIADLVSWVSCTFESTPLRANELDKKLYFKGQLVTELVIPSGATSIATDSFANCGSIKSVTIPKGVTKIGTSAFINCSGIESVTIAEGVTSIENHAFFGCKGLVSVTISEGVTSIGAYAFSNCEKLVRITIPKSLTNIGSDAFSGCVSLAEIDIADLASWMSMTFNYNNNPLQVNSLNKKLYLQGQLVTELVIPAGATRIREGFFANWGSIKSVTIPEGVTEIESNAFANCKSLVSIHLPKSIKLFGAYAFSGCESLKDVYITDLAAWLNMGYMLGDVKANPLTANTLEKNLYLNGKKLTDVSVPEGTKWITGNAFYNCSSLTSITIPEGVSSIAQKAFYGCTKLRSITIPTSISYVDKAAFSGCYSLWHVLYTGTEAQWNQCQILEENNWLTNATRHYGCKGNEVTVSTKDNCTHTGLLDCAAFGETKWEKKASGAHNYVNGKCTKCGDGESDVPVVSTNNDLAGITVDGFALSPAFSANTTRYVIYLPYEVQSVSVSATARDSKTTVTVEGGDALIAGADNEIKVVCIAEDGSYKVYLVIAKRASADGEYPESTEPSTEPEQEQPTEPSAPDTQQPTEGTDDPGETEAEQTQPGTDPVQPDKGGKNDGVVSWVFLPLVGGGCLGIGIVISKLPLLKKKR